ncbi:MAG: Phosphatidylserine decarboxylase proenzyme [Holosporales bacterium]
MDQIFKIIHPEGWRFFGIFFGVTILCSLFSNVLFLIGMVLSLWCLYFFRDPIRVTPMDDDLVISPADGRVVDIKKCTAPKEMNLGDEEIYKISIFLNVFNVHINRSPIGGIVKRVVYFPGRFFNASLDKASEHNERNALVIETPKGIKIGVVQIAGLIARRIVTFSAEADSIKAGERFGLIRFGSRVDVYLPSGIQPMVLKGQTMIAGETVLAHLNKEQFKIVGCHH